MSLQRTFYLASRVTGDVRAAQRGRLFNRLVGRYRHRLIIRMLGRGRIW